MKGSKKGPKTPYIIKVRCITRKIINLARSKDILCLESVDISIDGFITQRLHIYDLHLILQEIATTRTIIPLYYLKLMLLSKCDNKFELHVIASKLYLESSTEKKYQ